MEKFRTVPNWSYKRLVILSVVIISGVYCIKLTLLSCLYGYVLYNNLSHFTFLGFTLTISGATQ